MTCDRGSEVLVPPHTGHVHGCCAHSMPIELVAADRARDADHAACASRTTPAPIAVALLATRILWGWRQGGGGGGLVQRAHRHMSQLCSCACAYDACVLWWHAYSVCAFHSLRFIAALQFANAESGRVELPAIGNGVLRTD